MNNHAAASEQADTALIDVQEAILIFMRSIEAIDSGRVKKGRDQAWSAIGLLFEAEAKMQLLGDGK